MRSKTIVLLILLCFAIFSGCVSKDKDVEGWGTIRYVDLEGGFYGIVADDGEHYDPVNLSSGFEVDGLRAYFKGKIIRDKRADYHMWGTFIEIIDIRKQR